MASEFSLEDRIERNAIAWMGASVPFQISLIFCLECFGLKRIMKVCYRQTDFVDSGWPNASPGQLRRDGSPLRVPDCATGGIVTHGLERRS